MISPTVVGRDKLVAVIAVCKAAPEWFLRELLIQFLRRDAVDIDPSLDAFDRVGMVELRTLVRWTRHGGTREGNGEADESACHGFCITAVMSSDLVAAAEFVVYQCYDQNDATRVD